jgi:hypothetical protein
LLKILHDLDEILLKLSRVDVLTRRFDQKVKLVFYVLELLAFEMIFLDDGFVFFYV